MTVASRVGSTALVLLLCFLVAKANSQVFAIGGGSGPPAVGNTDPPIVHVRNPLTAEIQTVAAGNNQFAIDIYRQLAGDADPGKNLLVSPLSISTALAMTYAGARGQTAQQMADALHFSLPERELHGAFGDLLRDLTAEREGYELNVANRLFGQQGMSFKSPFLDTTLDDYGAPLEQLDFISAAEPAREHINGWVEDQTNDRIKNLLPQGSVTSDTRLVLTNAIYFDGDWKYKFDAANTRDARFHLGNGQLSQASMMFQNEVFKYGQFDGYQMLEMPYAGDDLSMVVMLPDEHGGLAALEASLSADSLEASLDGMQPREVLVHMPKFTFESSFGLSDSLRSLGIVDAFTDNADFTGIADGGLAISDVIHKAFIEVSEEGTEAAAATGVIVGITSCFECSTPPPTFRADHPFLFALRDTHTGGLMFLGRVNDVESLSTISVPNVPEPSALWLLIFGGALVGGNASVRGRRQFHSL